VGEFNGLSKFNGRRLYTALRLDYRDSLWAPTSASRAISAVAELFVTRAHQEMRYPNVT